MLDGINIIIELKTRKHWNFGRLVLFRNRVTYNDDIIKLQLHNSSNEIVVLSLIGLDN